MLTDDDEFCELFTHGNVRAVQCLQRSQAKKMILTTGQQFDQNRGKFFTALIYLSGSLICVSFGTMFGWPSSSFPKLLSADAPIPITYDQSAMIAGMLLNGIIISTPFGGCPCIGSKIGVVLGAAFQIAGWLLMIGANNILCLVFSRILVGIGSGFGMAKFKFYLKELLGDEEGTTLGRYLPVFIGVGVIIAFCIGPFVPFQMLPIAVISIPTLAFMTFIFVPDTPYNLYKKNKVPNAIFMLQNFRGKECSVDTEIEHIKNFIENRPVNKSIFAILREGELRKKFFLMFAILFLQQFCGGPSVIVYSLITHTTFGCYYPPFCSIIYAITFTISTWLGLKYVPSFNRKTVLLVGFMLCTMISSGNAAFLFFKPEEQIYSLIPLAAMNLFGLVHTVLITIAPVLIINDIFPPDARYTMQCFLLMFVSELAIIITKIYQVLFSRHGMYWCFVLYACVSTLGFFFIAIFFSESKQREKTSEKNNAGT